jgi:hypothetical protein
MKNIKTYTKVLSIAFALIMTSCSDWIDPDLNIDPDTPSEVSLNLLLTPIEQKMGFSLLGNDAVRLNNMWTQHFNGIARQSYTQGQYQVTGGDVDNLWTTAYPGILQNSKELIERGTSEGNLAYAGVGRVCQMATIGIMTDLMGDLPYTEALKGVSNLRPTYDTQEFLYETIFTELDIAIENLEDSAAGTISGDIIFDNDLTLWIKAAYSIKARHYLQIGEYQNALDAAANGFAADGEDFGVLFETANESPFYQFVDQRGDIRMGKTFVDMLNDQTDPRISFYASENADGEYVGSAIGSEDASASDLGSYIADKASTMYIMTFSELKFIEAECKVRLSQTGADASLKEAISASLVRVTGSADDTWVDDLADNTTVDVENIIKQKYIDGFGTNQPYADYRRTGFPTLSLATGAKLSEIPVRFPYPQSEINYNKENVPSVTLTTKLWWNN